MLKPNFDMEDRVAALLCLRRLCEEEYDAEITRVGTRVIPYDLEEHKLWSTDALNELHRFANITSPHAFELANVSSYLPAYMIHL